jgi:hypothetical protein
MTGISPTAKTSTASVTGQMRRSYAAPRLTTYGAMRELTASGSSGTPESVGQPTRLPRP